jgi:hypothetical protein
MRFALLGLLSLLTLCHGWQDAGGGAADDAAAKGEFDPEDMLRTHKRLNKIMNSAPAAFSPVLKFPEVFILVAV